MTNTGILRAGQGTEVEPGGLHRRGGDGGQRGVSVRDRSGRREREYPKAVADAASLGNIMLFYDQGGNVDAGNDLLRTCVFLKGSRQNLLLVLGGFFWVLFAAESGAYAGNCCSRFRPGI